MHSFKHLHLGSNEMLWGIALLLLLSACSPRLQDNAEPTLSSDRATDAGETTAVESSTRLPDEKYDDLKIVTLLPRDAIPAIDNPKFLEGSEADRFYDPAELVIGVEFHGDARAYSVPFLSGHEIVNDTVGGVKIAVTW